jgi:hypothetical protein
VRSGIVAIEEEFRLNAGFGKGGNRAGMEEKGVAESSQSAGHEAAYDALGPYSHTIAII